MVDDGWPCKYFKYKYLHINDIKGNGRICLIILRPVYTYA